MKSGVATKDLQREYQELLRQLKAMASKDSHRRSRLRKLLERANADLCKELEDFPEFHSPHYERKYGEFRRSFALLDVQARFLLESLDRRAVIPPMPASQPASENLDEWPDWLDDLRETIEDYDRQLERQYRVDLVNLIELLDAAERLVNLDIPSATARGKAYCSALKQLKQITQSLGKRLRNSLKGRRVKVIDLHVGQYPPIETTRVVLREDDGTGDNVVVTQIIEKGYLWKGTVLRKAAVVIATQKEK
jgi:molecular chaperone GrpE (heat shock protein)